MHGAGGSSGPYSAMAVYANVLIAFIGAGILGLPYAFSVAGVVEGTLILGGVAYLSCDAMLLLVDCKGALLAREKVTGEAGDALDYGGLAEKVLGPKAGWLVTGSIVASQMFFGAGYLIFIMENVASFTSFGPFDVLLGTLVPLCYLCNIRDLTELGTYSLLADAANVFAYMVVFYFDFSELEHHGPHAKAINLTGVPFFIGVSVYCFEGAGMILALESSVPASHRATEFPRIFRRSIAIIVMLYILFGVSGYLSFGGATEKIITLNLPHGPFPFIVKMLLCFSLFFTFPVMMFPVSTTVEGLMSVPTPLTYAQGFLMRTVLVAAVGAIVVVIPDFAIVMGLIGSTCCMLLALIMPPIIHAKVNGWDKLTFFEKAKDILLLGLGLLGSLLGCLDIADRIWNPEQATAVASTITAAATTVAPTG